MKSGGVLLSQFLEAFHQTARCDAIFGSQRRHEEVDVVKQGHVIVAVRFCHLVQLSPAIFDAHACHRDPKQSKSRRSIRKSIRRR